MTLTLDEAIRVNTVLMKAPVLKDDPLIIATLQLDIEALKRINVLRDEVTAYVEDLLPGETEPEPQPTREEVRKYMAEHTSL